MHFHKHVLECAAVAEKACIGERGCGQDATEDVAHLCPYCGCVCPVCRVISFRECFLPYFCEMRYERCIGVEEKVADANVFVCKFARHYALPAQIAVLAVLFLVKINIAGGFLQRRDAYARILHELGDKVGDVFRCKVRTAQFRNGIVAIAYKHAVVEVLCLLCCNKLAFPPRRGSAHYCIKSRLRILYELLKKNAAEGL